VRRPVLVVGFLALGAGVAGARVEDAKRVTGRAETVSSVCGGGAAISRQQLEALPPPAPIGGREFLVVRGETITDARPSARFVTRADGTFTTRLPLGTWCLFDASRRPKDDPKAPPAPPKPGAEGCLEALKRRCDLVLAVKGDVRDAAITFTQRCPQPWNQPCYRGPMPP
jgi:hypothetical protein